MDSCTKCILLLYWCCCWCCWWCLCKYIFFYSACLVVCECVFVLYAFYIALHFNIQSEQLTRHRDAKANHFPFWVSFFAFLFSLFRSFVPLFSFLFFSCIIFRRRRRCLRKHNHKRRIFRMYFVHNMAQCMLAPSSPASQRTIFSVWKCVCVWVLRVQVRDAKGCLCIECGVQCTFRRR